jgi:hypothetical protein
VPVSGWDAANKALDEVRLRFTLFGFEGLPSDTERGLGVRRVSNEDTRHVGAVLSSEILDETPRFPQGPLPE